MSIRSMMVPLSSNTERQSAALEAAVNLAKVLQAHLDVLYLKFRPEQVMRSFASYNLHVSEVGESFLNIQRQIEDQCTLTRATFTSLCQRYDVPTTDDQEKWSYPSATWMETSKDPHDAVAQQGRLVDLIVAGKPAGDSDEDVLEDALRNTGRPVIMAPKTNARFIGRRVAIAWNGSLEAARAVSAAIPFLIKAEQVTILTAQSDKTTASAAENARAYLAHHGIAAKTAVFNKNLSPPVGKAILERCRELETDLLVMGAYTHSRVHELLLGGVTRHMMAHADRPVLMMH